MRCHEVEIQGHNGVALIMRAEAWMNGRARRSGSSRGLPLLLRERYVDAVTLNLALCHY